MRPRERCRPIPSHRIARGRGGGRGGREGRGGVGGRRGGGIGGRTRGGGGGGGGGGAGRSTARKWRGAGGGWRMGPGSDRSGHEDVREDGACSRELMGRAISSAQAPLRFLLEHDDGRDRGGSDRGKESGEQRRRAAEHDDRSEIGADVPRADLIEETREQPRHGERTGKSQHEADRDQPQPLTNDEADDISGPGAQGPADRELPCPLPHQVRQHAEDAHGGQDGRHTRKQPDHLRAKPGIRQRGVEQLLHGLELDGHGRDPPRAGACEACAASDASSSEVRARMDGELPMPCVDAAKITGGAVDSGPATGCRQRPRRSPSRAPCDSSPSEYAVQWATRLERRCVPGSR